MLFHSFTLSLIHTHSLSFLPLSQHNNEQCILVSIKRKQPTNQTNIQIYRYNCLIDKEKKPRKGRKEGRKVSE